MNISSPSGGVTDLIFLSCEDGVLNVAVIAEPCVSCPCFPKGSEGWVCTNEIIARVIVRQKSEMCLFLSLNFMN